MLYAEMAEYGFFFLVGGAYTCLIVALQRSNHELVSAFATLVPVFTVVAYLFLGLSADTLGAAIARHAWTVLVGTLVAWAPYMVVVATLAPRVGGAKAVPAGLAVFTVLALAYVAVVKRYRPFGTN